MLCPDCNGKKITIASHVSYANGKHGYNVPLKCSRCDGTGEVPDVMADWMRRGAIMRDRRLYDGPYRTLGAEARRLGITAVELSQMEMGKIEPREDLCGS
jgi:hypothetical protein